jgi:hypothetical protein
LPQATGVCVQLPVPLQCPTGVAVPRLHDAEPQDVLVGAA